MDWESVLNPLLEFNVGKFFEEDLFRSKGRKIHASNKAGTNFDALQSCLNGSALDFLVTFQSHNHFKLSVSCKTVGFAIYEFERFTSRSFDVYFHLWSNDAPHWEREKRLWEAEEAKRWSQVVSKQQKNVVRKPATKVRFAEKLCIDSPIVKMRSSGMKQLVKVGSFELDLSGILNQACVQKEPSGVLRNNLL
jgi:hypothetical protein